MHIYGTEAEWRLIEAVRRWLPDYDPDRIEKTRERVALREIGVVLILVGGAWAFSHSGFAATPDPHAPFYPILGSLALARRLTSRLGGGIAAALAIGIAIFQMAPGDLHHLGWFAEMVATILVISFSADIGSLYNGGGRHRRLRIASNKVMASSSPRTGWSGNIIPRSVSAS
jgi:hypothetical protein